MNFQPRRDLDVKSVSQICKMLLQTAASYSGYPPTKNLQRQTLSWDCPFNSRQSKQFNLDSKVLEYINRAYYNLNRACLTVFIGQV
jgi:hypothetical protein